MIQEIIKSIAQEKGWANYKVSPAIWSWEEWSSSVTGSNVRALGSAVGVIYYFHSTQPATSAWTGNIQFKSPLNTVIYGRSTVTDTNFISGGPLHGESNQISIHETSITVTETSVPLATKSYILYLLIAEV